LGCGIVDGRTGGRGERSPFCTRDEAGEGMESGGCPRSEVMRNVRASGEEGREEHEEDSSEVLGI